MVEVVVEEMLVQTMAYLHPELEIEVVVKARVAFEEQLQEVWDKHTLGAMVAM